MSGPPDVMELPPGERVELPRDTATWLLGLKPEKPTPLHVALWQMTANCLGLDVSAPVVIFWAVADTIVGDPSGALAYGAVVRRDSVPPLIVIQREFWFNPATISHEYIHLITGIRDEAHPVFRACMFLVGQENPLRILSQERLGAIRARALRSRGGW